MFSSVYSYFFTCDPLSGNHCNKLD
uniref:Uncharacterized protein n=1 Tax=Anguilla anguilla TaxID=7936 RepID=A0A0E9SJE5_ANGAN